MSQFKTPKFKALQDEWYKKLKSDGFEDIEADETKLKRWDSHVFYARHSPTSFAASQEYFRYAGIFLHEHEFKTKAERVIWELHSEGMTTQAIFETLRSRRSKITRNQVYATVKSLSDLMRAACLKSST